MMISTPEFKVGVLVVVVAGLIGFMSMKVAEGPGIFSGNRKHTFVVDNAGGLVKNSAVKMAGIKVGIIDEITLADGKARVHLILDSDVPLTASASAELRADGILGDKHVELVPGNPTDPPLTKGKEIPSKQAAGSIDQLVAEVGKITGSLSEVAETLNKATKGSGDNSTTLGRIIINIENLTRDLSEVTGKNKDKINNIIQRVENISVNIDEFLADDNPEGFKSAWQRVNDSLARLDTSLQNVEEITDKVNRGEGTIGRLINDETTVNNINTAIDNVNDFLGDAGKMETSIDFHSEYLADVDKTKSYLNVKIQPGLDRYYVLGVVDDPEGVTRVTDVSRESGGTTTELTETKTFRNKIKFNAIFAKNFYDFTVKGGIMENAGGLGFDYYLFSRKLRLSVEAFDFEDMNVRAFARYSVMRGIYLVGGGNDLVDSDEASTFVGGGIFITNDDLRMFASALSF